MIERLKRVDALVDGLLRYANADHEESEAVPVALAPLFDDLSTWSIGETTTLALEIGAMPEYVGGSATALRQVLANLLDNSRKHHDRSHGVVEIEAQPTDDGRVAFVVRDDGPGIPEAAAAQVFDLFRTLASDSDAAEQNLGMGLAIARRLVERAGGSIALVRHVGRGATFTFTWPAAPEGDLS
jgi:signal transduction histidine kinase